MSVEFSNELRNKETIIKREYVQQIIWNYEKLLNNIQNQVNFYKIEHEKIRGEINLILDENSRLSSSLNQERINSDIEIWSDERYKKTSACIIENLQHQIKLLSQEKSSVENLFQISQATIGNLELALREYSKQFSAPEPSIEEIKNEFKNCLLTKELNNVQLKKELDNQVAVNLRLNNTKLTHQKYIEELEQKYNNLLKDQSVSLKNLQRTESILNSAKARISEIMKSNFELETTLSKCNAIARDQTSRETEALHKVQDALQIAETALLEKNEAILRERTMKEECDFLAITIAQVMDDAAKKVESEIDVLKSQYNERIQNLNSGIENLNIAIKTETDRALFAENNVKHLENELNNAMRTNKQLDSDLHIASQAIIELELKLEAFENLMKKEEENNLLCEERAKELQDFLKYSRKLKEKWRITVEEMTNKLQSEITMLRQNNIKLQKENWVLKQAISNSK